MELQTAIEILEYHQEWRLGKRDDMIHEPKKITEAFDIVLSEVNTKNKIMTDKELQIGRELSDAKAALATLTEENRRLKTRQKKLAVKYSKCVNLDDVVDRNYFANVKRLKISDKTTVRDFLSKIHEEVGELIESWDGCDTFDKVELADVTLVCFSMAKHFDINLFDEMEKKMKVNEKRND